MICTEDENLKDVTSRIECVCGKRHKVEYDVPCINYSAGAVGSYFPAWYGGTKKEIEVGGAIIFAVDVCYYEKNITERRKGGERLLLFINYEISSSSSLPCFLYCTGVIPITRRKIL